MIINVEKREEGMTSSEFQHPFSVFEKNVRPGSSTVKSNVVERKTYERWEIGEVGEFANIINDVSSPRVSNFGPDIQQSPRGVVAGVSHLDGDTRKVLENNYKFVPLNPECAKQRGNSRIAIRWLIQSRANAYWSPAVRELNCFKCLPPPRLADPMINAWPDPEEILQIYGNDSRRFSHENVWTSRER